MNHLMRSHFRQKIRVYLYSLMTLVVLATAGAHASTLDEIRALEALKSQPSVRQTPVKPDAPQEQSAANRQAEPGQKTVLPDGRQVNVDDYRVVLFMQAGCHFCQQFDPQLAQFSAQTGLKVFPYTLDGHGDASFPNAIPAPRAVLDQFFGPGSNGVTPTTFLVNVNTLQSWPLAQGTTDMNTLLQRINQALESRG